MRAYAHRIGAVLYVAWGVLHLWAAWSVYSASTTVPPEMEPLGGRIFQNAWNMFWISVAVIVIAVAYNWKNRPLGYWANLTIVSLADLGYIFAVVAPGYAPLPWGLTGPAIWSLAAIFSTIGILAAKR